MVKIECGAVMENALANLKPAIEESRALITHDSLPGIYADESQLTMVFQNLIGNAIKFHGPTTPEIHITAAREGQDWVFTFKDNGIGIDQRFHERIFIIFQRLHSQGEYPGTGIGLALVKKIIERHGGKVRVHSEPGQGSTFTITIPDRRE